MKIHDSVNQDIIAGIGGGSHTIQNSEIYNSGLNSAFGGGNGIQMQNLTTSSTIQNNYIHDIGLNLVGGNHAVYDQVGGDIDRFNHFKNVLGGTGIKTDGAGILIYGNLFDSIPSGGIYIDPYSNVKVYNNTFYNNGTISPYASILFVGDGAESGVEAKNNIIYVSSGYSVGIIVQTNATGFSSDHNDVFGAWFGEWPSAGSELNLADWKTTSGQDSNSTSSDPKFTNSAGGAFSLASSSPAIDTGLNLGSTYQLGLDPASAWPSNVITDNQNSFGARWDMGAYVYTQTSTPSVAITAPANLSTVSSTVTVSASSTAASPASIASVQFYLDGSPLGSAVTSSPYAISWNTAAASNASHTLYALTTDNYSNTATSTSITVTVLNQAVLSVPTSKLNFSAAHGSTATSSQSVVVKNTGIASTTLNWLATSTQTWLTFSPASSSLAGGASTTVSFIVNPSALALGTYNATATISDPAASSSPQTIPVVLTISTTGVSATMTAPAGGATVTSTVAVTATATSTVGISSVQFYLDGSALGSAVTSSPYTVSWNTATASNANHTLYALATDNNANTASSSVLTITVDNLPPSVSITSPVSGATVSGSNVSIVASSTDTQSGVASVAFYLDGSLLGQSTSSPFTATWDTTQSSNGTHNLSAIATDGVGNATTSAVVSVTVNNVTPPSPVVSTGGGGSTYSISINNGIATTATPSVTLSLYGSGAYTMELSNSSIFSSSTWIPYVTSLPWTLASGTGEQTVFVQYRSISGNIVGSAEASIDLTAPSVQTISFATSTAGMSVSQMQNLLTSLEAQLQALQSEASGTTTVSFARNLSYGMTGNDVKALQSLLIKGNAGPAARRLAAHGATTNFGPLTKAALIEFQKSVGIKLASGYFGPITRAYVNAHE
jgi:hypothetical protein